MFDWHRLASPLPPVDTLDRLLNIPAIMAPFYHVDKMTCLWWIRLRRIWRAGYFHADDCGPDGSVSL
jgi:hypothetical protein